MECVRCSKPIPEGSRYCLFCGKRQGPEKATKKQAPHRRRAKGSGSITRSARNASKPWLASIKGNYIGYFATPEEAEKALYDAKQNITDLPYQRYTMAQVFDKMTSAREWQEKNPKYQKDMLSIWNYMAAIHDQKAAAVRHEELQEIIYQAADEGRSQSHQKKIRLMAQYLCRWCMQHDIHSVDYSAGLKVFGSDGVRVGFEDADLRIIYQHRHERAAGLIWFMCMTGVRSNDLTKIVKDDRIDFTRHGIWLEGSKSAAGRNRYVPVTEPAAWAILVEAYNNTTEGEPLFKSPTGRPLNIQNFRENEFYPCLARLGIQPIAKTADERKYVPYSTRHTYASLARRAKVDIDALQRAMGHELGSDVTDKHYVDQVAHVDAAGEEFEKFGEKVRSIISD